MINCPFINRKYSDKNDNILWCLWYNGYEDFIKEIFGKIKEFDVNGDILTCKDIFESPLCKNSPEQILWMWLVLEFGDYGTSPRNGWIDDIDSLVLYLSDFMSKINDTDDYWECICDDPLDI